MQPRQRLIAAINHQTPDRCPLDFGGTSQTGINATTLYKLRKKLGLPQKLIRIIEPGQMLGEVDEDLRRLVGADVIGLWNPTNFYGYKNENWKPWIMDDSTPVLMGGQFECDVDENGAKWLYPQGDRNAQYSAVMLKDGSFFEAVDRVPPLDMDLEYEDLTPLEDFRDDFLPATQEDALYWEKESKRLFEETDLGIVGMLGGASLGDLSTLPGPAVKYPKGIRRPDDWILAHVMFPEYIEEVFDMQTRVMLKNLEMYRQAVGERIQVVWISGTDFGTQHSTFISPELFRKLYKPYYKKINDWVHAHTGWKTFFHSCGCVYPFMQDFVEMGVDILNPLQLSAAGMDAKKIKDEYGSQLTFWGGGVDTQHTLPFGTPDQVRQQVRERLEILSHEGGYIFATIHNVVADVPAENLIAMFEALKTR